MQFWSSIELLDSLWFRFRLVFRGEFDFLDRLLAPPDSIDWSHFEDWRSTSVICSCSLNYRFCLSRRFFSSKMFICSMRTPWRNLRCLSGIFLFSYDRRYFCSFVWRFSRFSMLLIGTTWSDSCSLIDISLSSLPLPMTLFLLNWRKKRSLSFERAPKTASKAIILFSRRLRSSSRFSFLLPFSKKSWCFAYRFMLLRALQQFKRLRHLMIIFYMIYAVVNRKRCRFRIIL